MGTMKVTFQAEPDGIHNLLTIEGGRPGPHLAYVRAVPSGLPLARLPWQNDQVKRYLTTVDIDEVTVEIDQDRTYPAGAEYQGEQYQLKVSPHGGPTRRARKAPAVVLAGDLMPVADNDPGDARFVVEDGEVPGVDVSDDENRPLAEARAAQHRAAAVPEQVSEDFLSRVRAMSAEARAAAESAKAQAEHAEAESERAGRAQREAEKAAAADERVARAEKDGDRLRRLEDEVLVDRATSVPVVADPPEAAGLPGQGDVPPTTKVEKKLAEQHEDAVVPPPAEDDPADEGKGKRGAETPVEEEKREEHEEAVDPLEVDKDSLFAGKDAPKSRRTR